MRYTKFGPTGMDVSVICLGCMSFGDPARGNARAGRSPRPRAAR